MCEEVIDSEIFGSLKPNHKNIPLNILFLSQVLPYPIDAGPKVRAYYNLRYLAGKHAVTLLSFVRPTDSAEARSHLKSCCVQVETVLMPRSRIRDGWAMLKSILSNQPFLITRDEVPEMDHTLEKLIQENRFDAIHADQLWMAPYALKARRKAIQHGYHPRIILDQHNAVHLIPKRMAEASRNALLKTWLKRESKLMADFEIKTCHQFDHVIWVTHEDFQAVSKIASLSTKDDHRVPRHEAFSEENTIIPICVDPAETTPVDRAPQADEILFVGGMHWPPNADGALWFAKEVLPLITKERPQSRFVAVGKQPPEAITTLGQQVFTPGYVANIDGYWANARVFVVPLRAGGGMRVKILDAWAKGIPIVSTTIGAEGIIYNPGEDILIADTPEEFSRAVIQVLSDNELALRLYQHGWETLENHYDWKKIYPKWDHIYPSTSEANTQK